MIRAKGFTTASKVRKQRIKFWHWLKLKYLARDLKSLYIIAVTAHAKSIKIELLSIISCQNPI